MVLLTLLALVAIGIVRLRNLFAVVILGAVYSFLIATVFLILDSPDVAMTEAAVGAGIATVMMLAALHLTKTEESRPRQSRILPLFVALGTGAALVYGTWDLPPFGEPDTPVHTHIGPYYLSQSIPDTGAANVVASVLASYRGFDTLGEVVVIFTAGIGVLLLLRRTTRQSRTTSRSRRDAV